MPVRVVYVVLCLSGFAALGLAAVLARTDVTAVWAAFGVLAAGAALVGSNRSRSKINI